MAQIPKMQIGILAKLTIFGKVISMKHPALVLSVLLLVLSSVAFSQSDEITITVRVVDNMTKSPVAGVQAECNGQSTTTNAAGFFQLTVPTGSNLKLTHEQYRVLEMPVPEQEKFQLSMDLKDNLVEYTDGVGPFYRHLGNTIQYPGAARGKKIQENVWVEILIGDNGKSQFVKAHNDANGMFTSTLKESINGAPGKWGDAYKGMTFLLPVKFILASEEPLGPFETLTIPKHRVMTEMVVTGQVVNR